MADTDSLERIRKALEEIDALPVEHSPAFKTAFAFQRLQNECSPVAIRSLLAREAALREALAEFVAALDEKRSASENLMQSVETAERSFAATERIWANLERARAALASTEPTKD